jgi:predicted NUDIX family NTP pyrophosphohydrolase
MPQVSAGLLLYRIKDRVIEVFLIHPGGPLWAKKDLGVWSIAKGLVDNGEDALDAAKREFHEETGFTASGPFAPLTPIKLGSGKVVRAWAVEGDFDARDMKSNSFTMEWPPHSGKLGTFPEADRGAWFGIEEAGRKISKGQINFLQELQRLLSPGRSSTITLHA